MTRAESFVPGSFYHVFNRGVDKRKIFLEEQDFWRFYILMFLLNDTDYRSQGRKTNAIIHDIDGALIKSVGQTGKPLVSILSFCLLTNHFHLLLRPLMSGGISRFMQRLSMAYSKYFNRKYERSGTLYESEFKAVGVQNEPHFIHIPRYIHLNALDLTDMNWREGAIENWDKALHFLDQYPWSSHPVFMGERQRMPVVDPELAVNLFDGQNEYVSFIKGWSMRESELLVQHEVLGLVP